MDELLTEWRLAEYIDIFKENKVDVQTLHLLDHIMIKELIKPIGDRARFIESLNLWKCTNDECSPQSQPQVTDEYVDVLSEKHRNQLPVFVLTDKEEELLLEGVCNIQQSSSVYSVQDETPSTSSTNTTNLLTYSPTIKEQALLTLLNKSAKGRNLLKSHQEEGLLSSNSRRIICNIIVEDLLSEDHDVRVTHETLLSFAQAIKNIFPKESISTYFVPYVNNNKIKVKTCAKGKLYDCLHNRKREYREAEKTNKSLKAQQVTDGKQNLQNENDNQDDVQQHILWLQNSIEPWRMVENKWRETATYRLKCLNNSDKTIAQYMTEFPALKSPAGYTLLTEDFKTLYPDKESLLHEKFCLYKDKILTQAKQKATRDETVKNTIQKLENISEDLDDDIRATEGKTITAFMVLPLLLGNPLAKVKKNCWRPSKQESREGFITHIVTAGELQTTILGRREKFSKLNVTLQPFIIIVGRDYTAIEKYYVVVNDTHYVLHSIIDAVDVCFKIFHTLNCRYPIECSSTWQFLQKGLYNLETPYDKQFVSVNSLITDLGIEID